MSGSTQDNYMLGISSVVMGFKSLLSKVVGGDDAVDNIRHTKLARAFNIQQDAHELKQKIHKPIYSLTLFSDEVLKGITDKNTKEALRTLQQNLKEFGKKLDGNITKAEALQQVDAIFSDIKNAGVAVVGGNIASNPDAGFLDEYLTNAKMHAMNQINSIPNAVAGRMSISNALIAKNVLNGVFWAVAAVAAVAVAASICAAVAHDPTMIIVNSDVTTSLVGALFTLAAGNLEYSRRCFKKAFAMHANKDSLAANLAKESLNLIKMAVESKFSQPAVKAGQATKKTSFNTMRKIKDISRGVQKAASKMKRKKPKS